MTGDADRPLLEADQISFQYAPGTPVLDTWSAQFFAGSMTALTGKSGRGKSTLLYLLGLMLNPSSGDVLVNGEATSRLHDVDRARLRANRFGFVFQDAALDATRTVMDNITETTLYRQGPRSALHPRAESLLEQFGVNVPAHRKPGQVSGGQAQRIALCRALLTSPPILLADEPTGNLDPSSTEVVVTALREHAYTGAAVIVVTHSPDVAAACDREIVL
ncbi:ABC transporter ATP-binding protein [Okibacterium endophyticum]